MLAAEAWEEGCKAWAELEGLHLHRSTWRFGLSMPLRLWSETQADGLLQGYGVKMKVQR